MSDIQDTIRETVEKNRVVLFMKGTKSFPQCGFSQRAVEILKRCGASFKDVNVLTDPAIREGIKTFSQWPTIPQVYIDGKFVGGSDILLELYQSGELQKLIDAGQPGHDGTSAPCKTPRPTKPGAARERSAT